jgi:hypothetical protein
MSNMESAACWARDTTLRWLILLMLHDGVGTSSAIEIGVLLCAIRKIVDESSEGKGEDTKDVGEGVILEDSRM